MGAKFELDLNDSTIIRLDVSSAQFIDYLSTNDYYGDYQIEVQGSVGYGSPATFFHSTVSSCTLTIVCYVDYLDAGEQTFESAELFLGKELTFDFTQYT